jgi:hypothetical protein
VVLYDMIFGIEAPFIIDKVREAITEVTNWFT